MLFAGPFNPPVVRQLLRINISLMVCMEFIQNVMLSFASSYLCGALGMTRQTYSLATGVYAGVAIIMIAQHHWFVSHLSYRRCIRYALIFFTVGALICAHANDAPQFIFGRAIQAIGGSAFFTAARVQVNYFPPTPTGRALAIRYMAFSLVGCSSIAPLIASLILDHLDWRWLFLVQLPQVAVIWWLSGKTISNVRKVRRSGKLHPSSMLALVTGVFIIQFVMENIPYDISDNNQLFAILPVALIAFAGFIYMELRRHRSLLPFRHLFTSRFLTGMFYYGLCYLLLSSINYLLPIFMQQGLGFPVLSCGIVISLAGLMALVFAWVQLNTIMRYPYQQHYLLFAFGCLALFGGLCTQFTPESTIGSLVVPLFALSGFTAIGQGTAAFNSFKETDGRIFSQAYQTKNMLRELMNSTGVSLTNVFLQHREALHYSRLAESLPLDATARFHTSTSGLVRLVTQQSTLLSCIDFFTIICIVGVGFMGYSMIQKRIR